MNTDRKKLFDNPSPRHALVAAVIIACIVAFFVVIFSIAPVFVGLVLLGTLGIAVIAYLIACLLQWAESGNWKWDVLS